jgi:hypothetical protein
VFDEDVETVAVERLRDLPVAATIVGGRIVHAPPDSVIAAALPIEVPA